MKGQKFKYYLILSHHLNAVNNMYLKLSSSQGQIFLQKQSFFKVGTRKSKFLKKNFSHKKEVFSSEKQILYANIYIKKYICTGI